MTTEDVKVIIEETIDRPKANAINRANDGLVEVLQILDAGEGNRWGFINEVVVADKLIERAWEVARLIESGPPLVYEATKEVVREAKNMQFLPALKKITGRQFASVDTLYSSEDQREGALAFAEKRDPVWQGK